MKYQLLATIALLATPVVAQASHVLTAGDLNASFDFNGYRGLGFSPTPTAGQLSTEAYAVTGFTDGDIFFGGTGTMGDFARGISTGNASVGGAYAFDRGGVDYAVGFQPTGSDFNSTNTSLAAFYVNIINNTGSTITFFDIAYDVLQLNDADASTTFDFSYAVATINTSAGAGTNPLSLTYTAVPSLDFTSNMAAGSAPFFFMATPRSATVTGLSVLDGQSIVLRFDSDQIPSSGFDEIGLDNLSLTAGIPEPGSALLLVCGLGLLFRRRSRSR